MAPYVIKSFEFIPANVLCIAFLMIVPIRGNIFGGSEKSPSYSERT